MKAASSGLSTLIIGSLRPPALDLDPLTRRNQASRKSVSKRNTKEPISDEPGCDNSISSPGRPITNNEWAEHWLWLYALWIESGKKRFPRQDSSTTEIKIQNHLISLSVSLCLGEGDNWNDDPHLSPRAMNNHYRYHLKQTLLLIALDKNTTKLEGATWVGMEAGRKVLIAFLWMKLSPRYLFVACWQMVGLTGWAGVDCTSFPEELCSCVSIQTVARVEQWASRIKEAGCLCLSWTIQSAVRILYGSLSVYST